MKAVWLDQARAEFARNTRLRLGLLVIATLLAVYEIAGLGTLRAQLREDYAAQQQRLVRVRSISHEDAWPQRAADAAAMRKALQAQIPVGDSVGLAQATFQGWLRQLAGSTGQQLSISMGSPAPVDGMPGYWSIPASLSGAVETRRALEVIRLVESRQQLVTIQSIRLTSGNSDSMSLDLVAYYRIGH